MSEQANVISAFDEEQVERLTHISVSQLRYWDRTEFFSPSLAFEERRRPYSRLYSFRDVACLQVLSILRRELRVSLQHLRVVKDKLSNLGEDMWATTTLYVLNRKVLFHNDETNYPEDAESGQGVLQIPLRVVRSNLNKQVDELRKRDPEKIGSVEKRRGVVQSRPVVAGTRIPVETIKEFSEAGYSVSEIQSQYPILTHEDIEAALRHEEAA